VADKIKKIYESLIAGAVAGLADEALFKHVKDECPKASSKKIVKASLLALSDDDIKDANILKVIYALAIKHRLDPITKDDIEDVPSIETPAQAMPTLKKAKASEKKLEENEAAPA
jgi:hypothetical protein